jgi:spermidine/putrescine transport system permease protein
MERLLKSYLGLVYAFMYLPVAVIALFSFNSAEMMAFPMTGFTIGWYDLAAHDGRLLEGLANTVLIAALTALISTTLGAMAGLALTRHRFHGQFAFAVLLVVPFFIPKVILAVADVIAMQAAGIPHSVVAIVAAQSLIILPFAAMVTASVLVRLDRRLEEAAADLGATGWQVFTRVQLPLMRNGLPSSYRRPSMW